MVLVGSREASLIYILDLVFRLTTELDEEVLEDKEALSESEQVSETIISRLRRIERIAPGHSPPNTPAPPILGDSI